MAMLPDATDQIHRAREHLEANRLFPAIAAAEEVLAVEAGHAEALYLRAAAMARMGHVKAWPAARAAAAAAPGDWRAHLVLSQALLKEGRAEECLAAARQAVMLAPRRPDVLTAVANVVQMGGDPAFARWAYEEALRVSPQYAPARHGLGEVELAEGRLGRAASHFAKAASAGPSPDSVAALREIARRLVSVGAAVAIGVLVALVVVGRVHPIGRAFGEDVLASLELRLAAGVVAAGLLSAALVALLRVPRAWRFAGQAMRQEPALVAGLISVAGTAGALGAYAGTGSAFALAVVLVTGVVGWISRALLS